MAANARAQAIIEDQKAVLGVLEFRYPNYVSGETLFKTVLGVSVEYTKRRLIRDLTYLNDKGLVKFRGLHGIDAQSISVSSCAFALTAEGYEVANRLRRDPAIDV